MRYTLHPRDYAKAFKFHYGIRSPLIQWFLIMLLVLFSWGVLMKVRDSFDLASVALASVCAVILGNFAFGGFLWSRRVRKQLRQMGKEHADVELEFDTESVRFSDPDTLTDLPWDKLVKWLGETRDARARFVTVEATIVDYRRIPHPASGWQGTMAGYDSYFPTCKYSLGSRGHQQPYPGAHRSSLRLPQPRPADHRHPIPLRRSRPRSSFPSMRIHQEMSEANQLLCRAFNGLTVVPTP